VPLPVLLESWPLFLSRTSEEELEDLMCISEEEMGDTLEAYVKRRKLCAACRRRVFSAFQELQTHQLFPEDADAADFEVESEDGHCRSAGSSADAFEDSVLLMEIRYCTERHEVVVPLGQVECLSAVLRCAEEACLRTSPHASTPEAAREEFLTCVSLILKERLQTLWRIKKSEEMVNAALCRTVAKIVLRKLQSAQLQLDGDAELENAAASLEELFREKKAKKKKKKKKKGGANEDMVEAKDAESDSDEEAPRTPSSPPFVREDSEPRDSPASGEKSLPGLLTANRQDEMLLLKQMGWGGDIDDDKENAAVDTAAGECGGLTAEEVAAFQTQANLQKVRECRDARIAQFERWKSDHQRCKTGIVGF
jgi:hypothetical protein